MNREAFFIFIYFLGVVIASMIRATYSKGFKKRTLAIDHKSTVDSILMSLPGISMFILPVIFVFTSWLDFANFSLPFWSGWIGVLFFVMMLWLLWKSHADLKHDWSPMLQIYKEHELMTYGLYARIRHPMYAAHLLWGIAQPLLLHNWLVGFSMLLTLLPLYVYRIPREEKMMMEAFGERYRSYINLTNRMIPYVW